jgi:hypothetical protein
MLNPKKFVKKLSNLAGVDLKRIPNKNEIADSATLGKAETFIERYREIISDPLNLLIERVPDAGFFDADGNVILHNGHHIPVRGDLAYYDDFSDILVINRGVHEPLEEYCFQQVLTKIKNSAPKMIELGAYWAHYSMWLLKDFPNSTCIMVEPDPINIKCGINNFALNKYRGEFIKSFVGNDYFAVDKFTSERGIDHIDILHSDIQGFEMEMLTGATKFLGNLAADYIFISTHSEDLHRDVETTLKQYGYCIEASSGFDLHTTSCDGFILARSPNVDAVFASFTPLGRLDIARASSSQLVSYVAGQGVTI